MGVSLVNVVREAAPGGSRISAADKHNAKGVSLQVQGRLAEAEACYRRALALKPGMVEVLSNLGAVLLDQRRAGEAVVFLERAVALRPTFGDAYRNLTLALAQLGRDAEGSACWRRLLRLRPNDPDALAGLAGALTGERRHAEAFSVYEQALRVRPDHAKTLFGLGLLYLQLGDYARGLPLFEHRHVGVFGRPSQQFAQPLWSGQSLAGRRILLYHDQGLGDTMQYLRYLPLMEAAGAEIFLLVQPAVRRLVRALPQHADGETFDLHCPLPTLPLAFGTRVESIPAAVPYLEVPEEERRAAAALPWPAAGLRVGLAWAGNPGHQRDAFRSTRLGDWEPLLGVDGVHFFSLQLGASSDARLGGLSLDAANMADAAAKMLHLDLVITVDTAMAHLAGALGLPVWILLDHWPDWRWLLDREDSPWYPTARLFRQERPCEWAPVVQRVAAALAAVQDQPGRVRDAPSARPDKFATAHVV